MIFKKALSGNISLKKLPSIKTQSNAKPKSNQNQTLFD
jgi:hypothetical protein